MGSKPRPVYDESQDKIGFPEKFGPGAWWILSVNAAMADNATKMLEFIEFLRKVIATLPCPMCHEHATAYITKNPPNTPKYFQMIDPERKTNIGMAYYIWEFHEAVNLRLGKASFPWAYFLPRYRDGKKIECHDPSCMPSSLQNGGKEGEMAFTPHSSPSSSPFSSQGGKGEKEKSAPIHSVPSNGNKGNRIMIRPVK